MPLSLPESRKSELLHEIACSDRQSLAAAYERVAEARWVESCAVDLPNLRLMLRLSPRMGAPSDASMRWVTRIQWIAQGRPQGGPAAPRP
jgi:hypothetical protein